MKEILALGATSAIAQACLRRWAGSDTQFTLVGRDPARLDEVAQDLRSRGATVRPPIATDLRRAASDPVFAGQLAALPPPDRALLAHGTLPEPERCRADVRLAVEAFETNASSPIGLLVLIGERMAARGTGEIIVLGSVAGDRGRPSNYLYGAAKAAVATFCEGWQPLLARSGVHLLLVKPGFVATPMTAGMDLPEALVVAPERIARDIDAALMHRQFRRYSPWFWWPIMAIIRAIPAPLFRRLKL